MMICWTTGFGSVPPGARAACRHISKTRSVLTNGSRPGLQMRNRRSSCWIPPILPLIRRPRKFWSGSIKVRGSRMSKKEYTPKRAMSIHAHPDDQEFTVAGTLAKWAPAGCEVVSVCITSGGAGSNKYTPLDMTRHALVALREDEQREACRLLGVKEPIFLGYED